MSPLASPIRRADALAVALTTLGSALLLFLLNPTPLTRPEFWAEDGELFFDAWDQGFWSLNDGVGGTLHTLGRLVAWSTTLFPVRWAPFVIALLACAVLAFAHGFLAHSRFEALIRGRWARMGLALALTVGAGTSEVSFNIANFPSALAWLALLALLYAEGRLHPLHVAGLALLFFSSPSTIALAPVVAVLLWREWIRSRVPSTEGVAPERQSPGGPQWRLRASVLSLGGAFLVAHALNVFLTNRFAREIYHVANQPLMAESNAAWAPLIYVDQLFSRLFVLPFLGKASTVVLRAHGLLFWPGMALLLTAVVWIVRRHRLRPNAQQQLVLVALVSAPVLFSLIAVARNYHAGFLELLFRQGEPFWDGRYSFLSARIAALFWIALAAALPLTDSLRRRTLLALIGLFAVVNLLSFTRVTRPDMNWPATAEAIKRQDADCKLPLLPLIPQPWKTVDCPRPR